MEEIQKKYANNREKMNEEMMKLYEEEHYNPASGCLPMLIPVSYTHLEAFYLIEQELAQGYDFVLVARVRTAFVSMQQVLEALRRACEKLGLLR